MDDAFWLGVAVLIWLALAIGLALTIGKMIRNRDRQVPIDEATIDRTRREDILAFRRRLAQPLHVTEVADPEGDDDDPIRGEAGHSRLT